MSRPSSRTGRKEVAPFPRVDDPVPLGKGRDLYRRYPPGFLVLDVPEERDSGREVRRHRDDVGSRVELQTRRGPFLRALPVDFKDQERPVPRDEVGRVHRGVAVPARREDRVGSRRHRQRLPEVGQEYDRQRLGTLDEFALDPDLRRRQRPQVRPARVARPAAARKLAYAHREGRSRDVLSACRSRAGARTAIASMRVAARAAWGCLMATAISTIGAPGASTAQLRPRRPRAVFPACLNESRQ